MKANEFVKEFGWDAALNFAVFCLSDKAHDRNFDFTLGDLKLLVKSYELVQSRGGLPMAKADRLFLDDYEKKLPLLDWC